MQFQAGFSLKLGPGTAEAWNVRDHTPIGAPKQGQGGDVAYFACCRKQRIVSPSRIGHGIFQ